MQNALLRADMSKGRMSWHRTGLFCVLFLDGTHKPTKSRFHSQKLHAQETRSNRDRLR